jgi:hypothetical protein
MTTSNLCKICGNKLRLPYVRCMSCQTETCKACILSEEWLHYENRCANKDCTGSVFADMAAGKQEPEYFKSIWDINQECGYLPPDQARRKLTSQCAVCREQVPEPDI